VTLHPIETLRTRALHLPLSAHRQLVALDLDLDVVLVQPRHLELDEEGIGGLVDVGQGQPARDGKAAVVQPLAAEAGLEEAVHALLQLEQLLEGVGPERHW